MKNFICIAVFLAVAVILVQLERWIITFDAINDHSLLIPCIDILHPFLTPTPLIPEQLHHFALSITLSSHYNPPSFCVFVLLWFWYILRPTSSFWIVSTPHCSIGSRRVLKLFLLAHSGIDVAPVEDMKIHQAKTRRSHANNKNNSPS